MKNNLTAPSAAPAGAVCNRGALGLLIPVFGLALPSLPDFFIANLQGWRLKRVLVGVGKILEKASEIPSWVVTAPSYACTYECTDRRTGRSYSCADGVDESGETVGTVTECHSEGTVEVIDGELAGLFKQTLHEGAWAVQRLAYALPDNTENHPTPDTLDIIGWALASVEADWGPVGVQLASLGVAVRNIAIGDLWQKSPDIADALFGEDTPEAEKEELQLGLTYAGDILQSLGAKLEEALTQNCDFACRKRATNCVHFTANLGIGGCAATCMAEKGDEWFQVQVAALCPPTVKVKSSLPLHLPAGIKPTSPIYADLANEDSPARQSFDAHFSARLAATLGIAAERIVVIYVGLGRAATVPCSRGPNNQECENGGTATGTAPNCCCDCSTASGFDGDNCETATQTGWQSGCPGVTKPGVPSPLRCAKFSGGYSCPADGCPDDWVTAAAGQINPSGMIGIEAKPDTSTFADCNDTNTDNCIQTCAAGTTACIFVAFVDYTGSWLRNGCGDTTGGGDVGFATCNDVRAHMEANRVGNHAVVSFDGAPTGPQFYCEACTGGCDGAIYETILYRLHNGRRLQDGESSNDLVVEFEVHTQVIDEDDSAAITEATGIVLALADPDTPAIEMEIEGVPVRRSDLLYYFHRSATPRVKPARASARYCGPVQVIADTSEAITTPVGDLEVENMAQQAQEAFEAAVAQCAAVCRHSHLDAVPIHKNITVSI
jgi:hypothetical protein